MSEQEKNKMLLLRLIEEGFKKGDLSVVDEIVTVDSKEHKCHNSCQSVYRYRRDCLDMAKTVEVTEAFEIPRPLDELSQSEIARKTCIGGVNTEVLRYLTAAFTGRGFTWLLPVIFSKSTDPLWPDSGASVEKRVETEIYDETVRTTLSMIIHKLIASSTAYPRFFVLSPNVRIEKRERKATGWHAYEFTQLDFEIRDAGFRDIKRLVEAVIAGVVRHVKKQAKRDLTYLGRYDSLRALVTPFNVCDRENLVAKYGDEWETRLPQEISEPTWVTNIPREFYDFEDPATGKWDNYERRPFPSEIWRSALRCQTRVGIRKDCRKDGTRWREEGELHPAS